MRRMSAALKKHTGRELPLNGTGLVFANPDTAPKQAYSWLVLPDLQVTSFIDAWASAMQRAYYTG